MDPSQNNTSQMDYGQYGQPQAGGGGAGAGAGSDQVMGGMDVDQQALNTGLYQSPQNNDYRPSTSQSADFPSSSGPVFQNQSQHFPPQQQHASQYQPQSNQMSGEALQNQGYQEQQQQRQYQQPHQQYPAPGIISPHDGASSTVQSQGYADQRQQQAPEQSRIQSSVAIKVGMVGDAQIGKTSLMVKYVEGSWDEDYIQTLGKSRLTEERA